MWTDSHCHIPYEGLGEDVLAAARAGGVTRMVSVGTDAAQSAAAVAVAGAHPDVWATVGLHPHDAAGGLEPVEALLADLGFAPGSAPEASRVVGIGECGLDYHYDHSPRDTQREVFARQIGLARSLDLALVIHTREAWDDTFAVLDAEGVPARTVFHCFTGGPEEARRALDRGAYLSFSGIVTFKTADDVRAAAALCPADRMLVETDAPYLAPVPFRGRRNEPAYLPAVGEALAAVRSAAPADIAAVTWENASAVFGLPG